MLKGIIAALWDRKERPESVIPDTVFFLNGGLFEIQERIDQFKSAGKRVFVDIDFVSGLLSLRLMDTDNKLLSVSKRHAEMVVSA